MYNQAYHSLLCVFLIFFLHMIELENAIVTKEKNIVAVPHPMS